MKTIEAIQAAQDAILAAADERPADERSLTTEEVQRYEALEAELFEVQRNADLRRRHALGRITGGPAVIQAAPKGDAALEFAFVQYLRTGHENADISALRFAQTEGTTTAGGFTVPASFLQRIVEQRTAYGGFRSAAESIDTGDGTSLNWPSIAAEVATTADITAEGAASAAGADFTFGTVTLGSYTYRSTGTGNVPVKVSIELAQDSAFDIGAMVSKRLGERIARKQAYDLVRGSGSGEPLGILYGTAGDVETASGSVPTYAKFLELVHALDPAYRQGASFLMNDYTMSVVEGIVDGNSRPLLVPSINGIADSVSRPTLLGYPVIIDQAAANLANDVQGVGFGNWREAYIVRNVLGVNVLVNPYGTVGYIQYDAWARMDGNVQNATAYVTMEGKT